MSGFATQVSKPRDEQAFERACLVLWRCILNDPNVQMNARRGQRQDGVDLFGFRDRDPARPVGVQCKLKGEGKRLSESELRDEVDKARKFRPSLREYFIVTTSPDHGELQRIARQLTIAMADAGGALEITVWGWETLEQHILAHQEAANAFDPTFGAHARRQSALLAQIVDRQGETVSQLKTLSDAFVSHAAADALLKLRAGPIFYRVPALPKPYQPPVRELENIRPALLADGGSALGIVGETTGLFGMGGIGKTVLASALVHDPVIRDAFPAGIVWLTFGRDADLLLKQSELALALSGIARAARDIHEGHGVLYMLSQQLATPLLVVLDDVWDAERTSAGFGNLGPNLRLLVTTRNRQVIEALGAQAHKVGLLDPDAAIDFLAVSAGVARTNLPLESGEVLRRCGGLPIALAAVGALIRRQDYTWSEVLDALREAKLQEFSARWRDDPAQNDLAAVLRVSVDALSDVARSCLLDFAVLREDAAITEAALLNIWSVQAGGPRLARTIAREIADRSVLSRDEEGRYTIHDLYRDFLRDMAGDLQRQHVTLLDRYRAYCPQGWNDGPDDGYFFQSIVWHIANTGSALSVLFDPKWLQSKLEFAGLSDLVADYRLMPNDSEGDRVAAALRLSSDRLAQCKRQLFAQLCGRLAADEGSRVASLVAASRGGLPPEFMIPISDGFLDRPGQLIRIFQAHDGFVNAISATRDGRRAVSASEDRTMILWDLETGAILHRFGYHDRGVNVVAIAEDRGELLSGSDDGALKFWSLETGDLLETITGGGSLNLIGVLQDQWRAVSASSVGGLVLWDIVRREKIGRFRNYEIRVTSLMCLFDGRVLTGDSNGDVILWDPMSLSRIRSFPGHVDVVRAMLGLPDGQSILAVADDGTARAWSLTDGSPLQHLPDVPVDGTGICILPGSRTAISGMIDGSLRLWDAQDGRSISSIEAHSNVVSAVIAVPGRAHLVSGSHDASLRLWDPAARAPKRDRLACGSGIYSLDIAAGSSLALSGSDDGVVRLWDLSTETLKNEFGGHRGVVHAVAFVANGQRALSGAEGGEIKIHELASSGSERSIKTGRGLIAAIVPINEEFALIASGAGTIDLLDVRTERIHEGIDHHRYTINALALTPDGKGVVSASFDNEIWLWDLETRRATRKFHGHSNAVHSVQVFPNGAELLSGSADGELRRWDISTGKTTRILVKEQLTSQLPSGEHRAPALLNVHLLPGAEFAVLCCGDNTVRIWDLVADREVRSFIDDHLVNACAIAPDSTWMLLGNQIGRLHRVRLDIQPQDR